MPSEKGCLGVIVSGHGMVHDEEAMMGSSWPTERWMKGVLIRWRAVKSSYRDLEPGTAPSA